MTDTKFGYIDATRGLAILMVVLVHVTNAVRDQLPLSPLTALVGQYGQLGVQLFFVASALTLGLSFDRRFDEERRLSKFYVRRFFRIAPMYYMAIGIYLVVAAVTGDRMEQYTLGNIAANVLFIHGFVPEALNDVVPGGWSIAGEMFFYIWFPFAFLAGRKISARFGIGPIVAITAAVFLLYAGAWHIIPRLSLYEVTRGNIFYYWAPAQVPVFLIGLTAYFIWQRFPPRRASTNSLLFIVFTALAFSMWTSDYVAAFAWVPSIAAVSFVFLVRALSTLRQLPAWLQQSGKASYSMYILHFLVVWFAAPPMISAFATVLPQGEPVLAATFLVTALLSFGLAWVSTRTIEAWGIDLGRKIVAQLSGVSPARTPA